MASRLQRLYVRFHSLESAGVLRNYRKIVLDCPPRVDEAAKGPYKEAEKMMIQQLKELQVLMAVTGQEQRNNIFPSKRD